MIDAILSVLYWFARPSIAAWAGATATLVAVFLTEPRRNLRRPVRFLRRIPRILVVWLIVAWLLSQLAGPGRGGPGSGGGRGEGAGPGEGPAAATGNADLTLRIRFLPRSDQPELARDFCCILRTEWKNGNAQEKTLQGLSLEDFEVHLAAALRQWPDRPGRIIVERIPFPGDGVLRRIRWIVHKAWPDQWYEEVTP